MPSLFAIWVHDYSLYADPPPGMIRAGDRAATLSTEELKALLDGSTLSPGSQCYRRHREKQRHDCIHHRRADPDRGSGNVRGAPPHARSLGRQARFRVAQPLPRNATGKVLKDVLRDDIAPRFVED
jgi:hypothetical protein